MLILDHPRSPPGGYTFTDPTGHVLTTPTIQALLAAIKDYRLKNGLPAGDPYKEYEAHAAVHHRWLISNTGTAPVTHEDPVARWINRQWRTPITKWAESETALGRYGQCLLCPHYVAGHALNPEANRRLTIMGAGHLGGMVGACKIHHWPCALACAAENLEPAIEAEDCWAVRTADSPKD